MSYRLSGNNPLSYQGVEPLQPPEMLRLKRDPISGNVAHADRNFTIGTFWLNTVNEKLWYLSNLDSNIPTWVTAGIGPSGDVVALEGNSGGVVPPNGSGIINVLGDTITVDVVGTPGTNTLTITALGSLAGVQQFTTDDANVVLPLANNVNIFGAHNINTTGAIAHTVTVAVNNTITQGDLAVVTAGNASITAQSGDITISGTGVGAGGNFNFPNTIDATIGVIKQGGTAFIHTYGYNGITPSAHFNTFVGKGAGNFTLSSAQQCTGIGWNAMAGLTTSFGSTAVGNRALVALQSGGQNTAVGSQALSGVTTGINNTAVGETCMTATNGNGNAALGRSCLDSATSGDNNLAIGFNTLSSLLTGSNNTGIGNSAGSSYNGAESNNICINNNGVIGDSGVIRIGTNATHTSTYLQGVSGVSVSNPNYVTINTSTGQLGSVLPTIAFNYISTAVTPYVVSAANDYFVSIDCSGGAKTVQLPNAPATFQTFVIKDVTGSAAAHNISVTTPGGIVTIDGSATYTLNVNFQSIQVIFNGSNYVVF